MNFIRQGMAISLFGILPDSRDAFGFCGTTSADSVRSVETPVETLVSGVLYRVRRAAETFCCTVYGYCRRVTAIARMLWHRAEDIRPRSFGRRCRIAFGWRL